MKRPRLWICLLLAAVGCVWFLCWRCCIPFSVPVAFSKDGLPLIGVELQGTRYPVGLVLTSPHHLTLSEDDLAGVTKRDRGIGWWREVEGGRSEAPLSEIPFLKVGDLELRKVLTTSQPASSDGSHGTFKWPLEQSNLVLDLPHHKVWGVNRDDQLKKIGIDLTKFVKIDCVPRKQGIVISVHTDLGDCNMLLDPGVNLSIMRDELCPTSPDECVMTSLSIHDQSLGEVQLCPYQIAEGFGVEGMLGADFLEKHIVYVDGGGKRVYIGPEHGTTLSKGEGVKLPIEFTPSGLPVTDIEINHRDYKVMLDLGSSFELTFPAAYFPADDLTLLGGVVQENVWGEGSRCTSYSLDTCRLERAEIHNVLVFIEEENLNHGTTIDYRPAGNFSGHFGTIGRPLLARTDCYFDFKNALVWLVSHPKRLKKLGVDLDHYEKIPFEVRKCGLFLTVKTDVGYSHFLLDTGTSACLIRPEVVQGQNLVSDELGNPSYLSSTFCLKDSEYGEQAFYPLECLPEWGDGIIGMDFLRKHAFYIDYQNRVIYFEKPGFD